MSAGPLVKLIVGAKTSDLNPFFFFFFPSLRASSHASNVSAPASQLHLVSSPTRERGSAEARCAPGRLEKWPPHPRSARSQPLCRWQLGSTGGETQLCFPATAIPAPAGTGHVPTVPGAISAGSGLCLSSRGSRLGPSITRAQDLF